MNGILVRDARESDYAFVLDAWRRSFESSPAVNGAEQAHYRAEMGTAIARLWRTSVVRIACDAQDDDVVLGFAAFKGDTLHFVYVRKDFRSQGLVAQLLEGTNLTGYTFRTLAGERRMKLRERGMVFRPRFTIAGVE